MDKELEELVKEIAQKKIDKPNISKSKLIKSFHSKIENCILNGSVVMVFAKSLNDNGVTISYDYLLTILSRIRKLNPKKEHKIETREKNQQNVQTNQKPEIKKQLVDDPNMSIRAMRLQSEREQAERAKNQLPPEMQAILDRENERKRKKQEREKNENSSNEL